MDSALYRHLMGQIKNSCIISHCNFPCHNLLSVDALNEVSGDLNNPDDIQPGKDFLNNFPCYNSFNYDVEYSAPLSCGTGMIDVAEELVSKKLKWEKKLKSIKIPNAKQAAENLKQLEQGNITAVPKSLSSLIRHFKNDPAPGFTGNYNWLYTGGNLVCKKINNDVILLGANYNRSGCNLLKLNDEMNEIEYKTIFGLKIDSPVYQISASVNQDNIFAVIRQKRSANIFQISDLDVSSTIKKLWGKKVNEVKFLTSSYISDDCKTVVLSDSVGDIHVYDLSSRKKIFGCSRKKNLRDQWTQIISKDSIIYLADRNSFSTLDFRDYSSQPDLLYDPSADTNGCEDFCSITNCDNNSNYVYLGTTHNIIQVDIRKKKSIQKWTHLMKQSPQFMSCIADCSNDLLIAQSSEISETVGITNEYINKEDSFNYLSKSLPCALNCIKKSLKFSKLNGLCLNPFVAERFNFTVTGSQIVQNDSGTIHLFTSNSGGDIFFSKIIKGDSKSWNDQSTVVKVLESMKIYETHFEDILPLKFVKNRQNELNMSHIIEDFRNLNVSKVNKEKSKFHWKYDEMFTEDSLKMYKDVLAQKILQVWNIKKKNETDDEDGDDDGSDDDMMSSTAKVREWMEKN